ncbi:alpha/beta hydrolase [Gorillibacterium massiliense]|uniref:alpha/beta hydrolase n=1 Tax=Gorillibacterium massiliense TaxID=1280390 RepID=UPI0004B8E400|nr:alpha/beta hydrolase [Gorillibacterium massiliense]
MTNGNWRFEEWKWDLTDRTKMYACGWLPIDEKRMKGVIGLVHGMGEHAGRYVHVAEAFAAKGYAVLSFDQRGHGQTGGKRGHTPSYEALLIGIDMLVWEQRIRYPNLPFFLYGHSMGGNVTLNYLLRRKPDIAGALVTGPWLELAFNPPVIQTAAGWLMEKVYPGFSIKQTLRAEDLTSDPVMIRKLLDDPLYHNVITAGFYFAVRQAGAWALAHSSELTVPLLLMHGGSDPVTSLPASKRFAEGAGIHCEFMEWPGYKHEIHNDTGRAAVIAYMLDWLNDRVAAN